MREGGDAGGRLIDLAADPRGGAVVVYGLFNHGNNDLMLQRLDAGNDAWTAPVLIASGDFGYLPAVTIAGDGTIYAVFNNGRNRDVDIGGLIADASRTELRRRDADAGGRRRHGTGLDRPRQQRTPWVVYMHQPEGSTQRDRDSGRSRGDVHAACSRLTADRVLAPRARRGRRQASSLPAPGDPVHNSNARAPWWTSIGKSVDRLQPARLRCQQQVGVPVGQVGNDGAGGQQIETRQERSAFLRHATRARWH